MEQYRSRRRGRGKTFHGTYGTIDPARTVAGRSARHVANPRRAERAQYIAARGHRQRGGRGPKNLPTGRSALFRLGVILAVGLAIALAIFLFTRPASAVSRYVGDRRDGRSPACGNTLYADPLPGGTSRRRI